MNYQNGLSRLTHPEVGKFYWTRNNTIAHFVGFDLCAVFYIQSERPGAEEDGPFYRTYQGFALRGFTALQAEDGVEIAQNYIGGAYGVGFDIMAELTEDEIEYFVPRGE